MSKQCTKCKEVKDTSSFCKNKNRPDGYQSACKSCMNIAYNLSRKKKKDHYISVSKKRMAANKLRVREWKEGIGCQKCCERDPVCLEFHHLDPSKKETHVSNVVRYWSHERLEGEISKCIILCSNCHKKFHAGKFELEILQS